MVPNSIVTAIMYNYMKKNIYIDIYIQANFIIKFLIFFVNNRKINKFSKKGAQRDALKISNATCGMKVELELYSFHCAMIAVVRWLLFYSVYRSQLQLK